jgi:hypothetical protein
MQEVDMDLVMRSILWGRYLPSRAGSTAVRVEQPVGDGSAETNRCRWSNLTELVCLAIAS